MVDVHYHQIFSNINTHTYIHLARFLKTLLPNRSLPPNSLFSAKNDLQSSHYKNQECNHCFFLFSSILSPGYFFFSFPFLFLRWCDFGAYRVLKICLLKAFHSNGCRFRSVGFQKIAYTYIHTYVKLGVKSKSHLHR